MRNAIFSFSVVLKLYIFPEDIEEITLIVQSEDRRVGDGIVSQPPQKDPDVRNVVFAAARFDAADLSRARYPIKRCSMNSSASESRRFTTDKFSGRR